MANIGDLVVSIVANTNQFIKDIDNANKKFDSLVGALTKSGKALTLFVTAPLIGLGVAAVKAAADMEMLTAEFTTLLGSGQKANVMLTELADLAATTPFQLTDLAQASKTMLSFGLNAESVIPNLQMLGDIAGGNSQKLSSLTLAFSQISSTGRLMGQDLLQLINAGFNPLQVISQKTGRSMADLKKDMEGGAISADMVTEAFTIATSEGGLFFGGMERASQTFTGQLSTLKDDAMALARSFGEILLPIMIDVVQDVSKMVKEFNDLSAGQKNTILAIGGIAAVVGPLLLGLGALIPVVQTLSVAFAGLGGPIAIGIAAVAGAIAFVAINTANATRQQLLFNDALAGRLNMEKTMQALEEKRAQVLQLQNSLNAQISIAGNRPEQQRSLEIARQRLATAQAEYQQISIISDGYQRQNAEQTRQLEVARREAAELANQVVLVDEQTQALQTLSDARNAALQDTIDEENYLNRAVRNGLMTQEEANVKLLEAYRKEQETLTRLGYSIEEVGRIGSDRLQILAASYNTLNKSMTDAERRAEKTALLQAQINQKVTEAKPIVQDYTEALRKLAEIEEERKQQIQDISQGFSVVSGLMNSLKDVINGLDESVSAAFGGIADIVSQIALLTGTAEGAVVAGVAQIAKGIVDIFDAIFNQAENDAKAIADLSLKTDATIIDNKIKSINILKREEDDARAERLKGIQVESDARIAAINLAEQAELRALGLQNKSEAERLRDEIERATNRGEFAKKKKLEEELVKAAITEKYELQRQEEITKTAAIEAQIRKDQQESEKAYNLELRAFNREKAISDKAIAVAQIQIAQQKALADLGWFASQAQKDAVTALYSKLLASTNGIPIPNLAQGAIIQPRAGGTMVNVAEAGVPEIVGPIDKVTQMLQTMGTGSIGGSEGNIHLVVNMEGKPFLDKIFQATRNRTVLISAGAVV